MILVTHGGSHRVQSFWAARLVWPQLPQSTLNGTHGEEGSAGMWKALIYFGTLPEVGMSMLLIFLPWHPRQHGRPRFVTYPNLPIMSKPFPWGMVPYLLHNVHVHLLPTSYEDE